MNFDNDYPQGRHNIAMKYIEKFEKPKVLDIGGYNDFWFYNSLNVEDYYLMDLENPLNVPNFHYVNLDHGIWWYANENKPYDIILCFEVLEHMGSPKRFVRNLLDVMGKGSILLLSLPNDNTWDVRLRFLFGNSDLTQYTNGLPDSRNHKVILNPEVGDRWVKKLFNGCVVDVVHRDGLFTGGRFIPLRIRNWLANKKPSLFCRVTTYKITKIK